MFFGTELKVSIWLTAEQTCGDRWKTAREPAAGNQRFADFQRISLDTRVVSGEPFSGSPTNLGPYFKTFRGSQ
jgi:hypothetical protein